MIMTSISVRSIITQFGEALLGEEGKEDIQTEQLLMEWIIYIVYNDSDSWEGIIFNPILGGWRMNAVNAKVMHVKEGEWG